MRKICFISKVVDSDDIGIIGNTFFLKHFRKLLWNYSNRESELQLTLQYIPHGYETYNFHTWYRFCNVTNEYSTSYLYLFNI